MTDPTELDQMIDQALTPEHPELHAWLDTEARVMDTPDAIADPPEWWIDGERTAAWAARKVIDAEAQRAAAKAEADRLRAVADDYESRVHARTERTLAFFEGRLRRWHDEVLATNPRRLTIELPGAKLTRRAGAVSTEVTDPDALRLWLEDRDDDAAAECLEYPDPKIKRAEVKARYASKVTTDPGTYPGMCELTGEVVPGVTFTRGVPVERVVPVPPSDAEESAE